MHYYGTRLSENISRREPEGYLLCLNVPVARTGIQEYLPEELGLAPGPGTVEVFRPEEEVFSPATVASFEGMPVTNDHPPEGVDVSNIRALQKGHAHNVRRGSGKEADLLLADLIITDPALIEAVLRDGKREISCGYTYELAEENGRYIQRNIRGNHVAVVDAGRAGSRVCIRDGRPEPRIRGTAAVNDPKDPYSERRKRTMKKSLSKVLARMAKDGDLETVAGIIEEMIEPEQEPEEAAAAEPAEEQPGEAPEETKNVIIDEGGLAGVLERLDRIIMLLEPAAADEATAETVMEAIGEALETAVRENADPMIGEIAAAMEEVLDPAVSGILEPEEDEDPEELPETLCTKDAVRAALAAVRPVLAGMPKPLRRKVAGDIAARLRGTGSSRGAADGGVYAALKSANRRTAPASAELGRRIMEKRNPNYMRSRSNG